MQECTIYKDNESNINRNSTAVKEKKILTLCNQLIYNSVKI